MIYFPSCLYKLVFFTIRDPIKHTAFVDKAAMIKKSNLLDNEWFELTPDDKTKA